MFRGVEGEKNKSGSEVVVKRNEIAGSGGTVKIGKKSIFESIIGNKFVRMTIRPDELCNLLKIESIQVQ